MVKSFLIIVAFSFIVENLFSQINNNDTNIRYLHYANTPENQQLFDSINTFGFYNLVKLTIDRLDDRNVEHKGISRENVAIIKESCSNIELRSLGLSWHLGRQATSPIVNKKGEDSVMYLPDGTTEYVYPGRDTIYTISGTIDDFVIKEKCYLDSTTNKLIWTPIELIARKKVIPFLKPIPIILFNWEAMYTVRKEWFKPLEKSKGDSLIPLLETFLKMAESQFDSIGCYQLIGEEQFWNYLNQSFVINREVDYDSLIKNWKQFVNGANKEELFLHIEKEERLLANEYGEDSMIYTPDGTHLFVYREFVDTMVFVKKGFDKLYEYRCLYFVDSTGWCEELVEVVGAKKTSKRDEFMVVYRASKKPLGYASKKDRWEYQQLNDPLYKWLSIAPKTSFTQFPWEEKLYNHTFSGIEIKSPY